MRPRPLQFSLKAFLVASAVAPLAAYAVVRSPRLSAFLAFVAAGSWLLAFGPSTPTKSNWPYFIVGYSVFAALIVYFWFSVAAELLSPP